MDLTQIGELLTKENGVWLVVALLIGAIVRASKPTEKWFTWLNVPARWRPLLAVGLGIIASITDKIVEGVDTKTALKFGVSAAFAAIMAHIGLIEVARDGREFGSPKLRIRVAAPGEYMSGNRPPPLGREDLEDE